ncbi:MAG: sensor histidine kinase [Chitinophagales bacterium]
MQTLFKYKYRILLTSIVLIIVSAIGQYFSLKAPSLPNTAKKMTSQLEVMEEDFSELIKDKELIRKIEKSKYSKEDLQRLVEKPYVILAYFQDQIFFWNSNEVVIPKEMLTDLEDGSEIVSLKNGFYHMVKKTISASERGSQQGEMKIIGLKLIQHNYSAENKYLKNQLNPNLRSPSGIKVSMDSLVSKNRYELENTDVPLYLYFESNQTNTSFQHLFLFIQFIGFFLLLLFMSLIARNLQKDKREWIGFAFLFVCFSIIGLGIVKYYIPQTLSDFSIFVPEEIGAPETPTEKIENPERQATIISTLSLGSFTFIIFLLLWSIAFFYQTIHIQLHSDYSHTKKLSIYIGFLTILLVYTSIVFCFIKILVLHFKIAFDITNFIYLEFKTIIGLLTLILLLVGFFLVCKKIAKIILQLGLPFSQKMIGLLVLTLLYICYLQLITFERYHIFVLSWLLIFILLLDRFVDTLSKENGLKRMLLWVFVFSAFTAMLLHNLSIERAQEVRQKIVSQVRTEEDKIAEFMFEDVAKKIMLEDDIIRLYYRNPLLPERELKERILQKHFGGSFLAYQIDIQPYNKRGHSLRHTEKTVRLEDYEGRMKFQKKTQDHYLSLIPNTTTGGYNYLAKLPIFPLDETFSLLGYLVIEMEKKSDKENVYPELIIEDKFREPAEYDDYSYAVYKDGNLRTHKGDYAYDYKQDSVFISDNQKFKYINFDGYSHLLQNPEKNKTIIVSRVSKGVMDYLSMFSHLFLISGITVLLLSFIIYIMKHTRNIRIRDLFYSSLRMRINVAMLSILLVSFVVIALVSIAYFYQKTTNYHQEILLQKQKEVLTSIESTLQKDANRQDANRRFDSFVNVSEWEGRVASLASIHSMDINLFDINGQLLHSSQTAIYERELRSSQMNPVAFYQMSQEFKSQFIHHEAIGKLSYLSSYVPIKNEKRTVVGFLNLPYFAKEKELRSEVSGFLVTLINVYVVIWLIAALLALAIANSITNPLKMISDKLKNIRLGQQNDLLEWPDNDEIGTLVTQYNETIIELDRSAKKLAKNEREYAWRQMARQVAHEIKNPLTPMKLSIQHLQRAIKDNRPNVKGLVDRVSRTLVEQIDTLSRIATEFSSFAQMPTPRNELMDINEVIENTVNLYEDTENVRLFKLMPEEPSYVNADKGQLIRVFNNLIKNAIQAIPDEKQGIIVVNIKKAKNSIVVGVADNGCGIDAEKKEKVFVPNFTTKNSGMGLGLAMSKNIVEAAKGRIWFESKVDEGTTFYVKLPLKEAEEPSLSLNFESPHMSDEEKDLEIL